MSAAPSFEPSSLRSQIDRVAGLFDRSIPDPDAELRMRMHALTALQRADGSWPLSNQLAEVIGRPLRDIEEVLPHTLLEPSAREAWATALALAWLESMAYALESEWHLLAAKARRWLDDHVAGSDLKELARRWLM